MIEIADPVSNSISQGHPSMTTFTLILAELERLGRHNTWSGVVKRECSSTSSSFAECADFQLPVLLPIDLEWQTRARWPLFPHLWQETSRKWQKRHSCSSPQLAQLAAPSNWQFQTGVGRLLFPFGAWCICKTSSPSESLVLLSHAIWLTPGQQDGRWSPPG